jgi:hypothetical protein
LLDAVYIVPLRSHTEAISLNGADWPGLTDEVRKFGFLDCNSNIRSFGSLKRTEENDSAETAAPAFHSKFQDHCETNSKLVRCLAIAGCSSLSWAESVPWHAVLD